MGEEKKSCLFEICDGDKIKDVKEKGYRIQYFMYKLMYSKRIKFDGYESMVAAYFKDKSGVLCDKSIRVYFDKWDKKNIEKLIREVVPNVRFNVPLAKSEPVSREVFFKVSTSEGMNNFIKYVKGYEKSMIRISLGPECVMIDKKNDYFHAKETFENNEESYNLLNNNLIYD